MNEGHIPRVAWVDALSSNQFDAMMQRHGYCVITDLPQTTLSLAARCDHQAEQLLCNYMLAPEQLQRSLQVGRSGTPSTRLRSAINKKLPLVGVGVHAVKDNAKLQRCQFHLLADVNALKLVPWPVRAHPALRAAVEQCCWELHARSTQLLASLGGEATGGDKDSGEEGTSSGSGSTGTGRGSGGFGTCLERERSSQVESRGDPSVLDLFVYPNMAPDVVNMRAHTDPGLLTLTLCSESPGLQILDRSSGLWVDVEASGEACVPGRDCIVLCGEALQASSHGVYEATLHRVRHAKQPRISTVFELRISDVPMHLPAPPTCRPLPASTKSETKGRGAEQQQQPDEAAEAGQAYMLSFVRSRLARGSSADDVLREFHVTNAAWPRETVSRMSEAAIATFLYEWVATCREREEAEAAFARAEFVTVTPAFADSTGRFVDVHFS